MTLDDAIALTLVAVAAAYLGARLRRYLRGRRCQCPNAGGCPASANKR